jgi:hypothetical protein
MSNGVSIVEIWDQNNALEKPICRQVFRSLEKIAGTFT